MIFCFYLPKKLKAVDQFWQGANWSFFYGFLMTIKEARKFLGKLAENISDQELEADIRAAKMLKSLYISHLKRSGELKNSYGKPV
jgi:hypothetical protein